MLGMPTDAVASRVWSSWRRCMVGVVMGGEVRVDCCNYDRHLSGCLERMLHGTTLRMAGRFGLHITVTSTSSGRSHLNGSSTLTHADGATASGGWR